MQPRGRRCSQEKLIGVAKCFGAEQYLLKARTYPKNENLKDKFKAIEPFKLGESSEEIKFEAEQSLPHDIPVSLPSKMARNSTKYGSPMKKENKRTQSNNEEVKAKSLSQNNTINQVTDQKHSKRLFEEFFVIGADAQSVDTQKIKEFSIIPPKKLYQYPNLPENKNEYYIYLCM